MTSSDHEQDHSSTMNSEFGGYQYDGSSFQFEVPAYQAANRPAISAPPRPSITLPQETFPTSAHQGPMAYPNSSDSSYEYYRGISGGTPSMLSYRGLTMGYSVNASVPPYNVAASKWHLGGPESTYHSPNVNLSVGRTGPSYYHSLDTQYLASMYSSRPSFPGHTDYGGLQSSTMISAYTRTDSESSPVSTATNGVRIADQSLSPNNGQSEAMFQRPLRQLTPKLVLAQPARTQPSNYGPMNPASSRTPFLVRVLAGTTRPLLQSSKHLIPYLDKIRLKMSESDQTTYLRDASTVYSAGSYDSHYPYHAPIYQNTIPAAAPPDETPYACPSASQNIIPPFAYDTQTLEARPGDSSHPLQQWAYSNSGYGEHSDPSLADSFGGYPTNMDAYPTTVPTSGCRRSTLHQPFANDFGATYPSEPQQGMRITFVDSFERELERLQQSNTSQTGAKSKPVPGSAEWANKFALQNGRVEKLRFQDAPVQHLESRSSTSAFPSESTAPQTALMGFTAAAFEYDGEMMAQAPPSPMTPYYTSVYEPPTANSWLDGSFLLCHLDDLTLDTMYSSGTAAQWLTPTNRLPQTVMTTPDPARLVPTPASPQNVDKQGQPKKRRGRPTTKCDPCHRRRRNFGCTGEIHGGSIERYHNENDGYTLHKRKGMDKLGNVRLEHCGQDQAGGGDHSTRSRLKQIS
ncbi:hypothetical protein HD553DRAFT_325240 [Filobasidium floriforme]|uniref:uncharacterized protein n=1 Tax=Filobasidium floriforme TaxID=5210 RepID=UPI001E8CCA27|nr:uncharacterized protein HD553DRAFT_325240 [Filobasidium floriforme]KAH8081759.1 hypothetical protein HD553DRAFT_325240 [Filobasidium floriforme]